MNKFDLIVIGAGQGGLPAAALAARLGVNVALIEMNEVGGTFIRGQAEFTSPVDIRVDGKRLTAARSIITTGSRTADVHMDEYRVLMIWVWRKPMFR